MKMDRTPDNQSGTAPMFSVLIPTWNNMDYLELAYRGLMRNSANRHEIIVFFNECNDKCISWAEKRNVRYAYSKENTGVCNAVNRAAEMAQSNWICFMNDDMYPLPQWDSALWQYADLAEPIWLSGTAVEPGKAAECYIGCQDYGRNPSEFEEERLLSDYSKLKRPFNVVSTWTPTIVRKVDWDAVGGLDEDYFPGFGSDPDFAMRMYRHGCRHFIGVGTSLVYHFSRSTTSRFDDKTLEDPRRLFKKKWGVSRRKFLKKILQRGRVIGA